jgi:hypothetical protein
MALCTGSYLFRESFLIAGEDCLQEVNDWGKADFFVTPRE